MNSERLLALDGLRGVAILLVLAYHYFSRFVDLYPYGQTFSSLGAYGFLGVELFFIISGFVIALTLGRCDGIVDFTARRFARLWPPMLVCSLLTFILMHTIDTPFTEARRVDLQGFLPSLTFVGPEVWGRFVEDAQWIDGAYWSLFVEVRFYFWAAMIYLVAPRHFTAVLFGATLLLVGVGIGIPSGPHTFFMNLLFFPQYLAFFAVGAIFFDLWRGEAQKWHWAAVLVLSSLCLYSDYSVRYSFLSLTILALFFVPFVLLCLAPNLLRPAEYPSLVWLGRRSYSLYLLHQNIGVALITLVVMGLSVTSYALVVLSVTMLMILLAHLVFETVERKSHMIANRIVSILEIDRSRSP